MSELEAQQAACLVPPPTSRPISSSLCEDHASSPLPSGLCEYSMRRARQSSCMAGRRHGQRASYHRRRSHTTSYAVSAMSLVVHSPTSLQTRGRSFRAPVDTSSMFSNILQASPRISTLPECNLIRALLKDVGSTRRPTWFAIQTSTLTTCVAPSLHAFSHGILTPHPSLITRHTSSHSSRNSPTIRTSQCSPRPQTLPSWPTTPLRSQTRPLSWRRSPRLVWKRQLLSAVSSSSSTRTF